MAAAAFSAATAVQRAQLMLQQKQKQQSEVDTINPPNNFNDPQTLTSTNMDAIADPASKQIPATKIREDIIIESQDTETGDLMSNDGCQKVMDHSNSSKSFEDEDHLRHNSNNNSNYTNSQGQFSVQNTVGEENDNATCDISESDQPIVKVDVAE